MGRFYFFRIFRIKRKNENSKRQEKIRGNKHI